MNLSTRRLTPIVGAWLCAVTITWAVAAHDVGAVHGQTRTRDAVEALSTWDGQHYTAIAEHGYSAEGSERRRFAFFPLMPVAAGLIGGAKHAALAGIIASQCLFLVALLLLEEIAAEVLSDDDTGAEWNRPAMWLLVSPLSFFFMAFYTESLFLVLVLSTVLAMHRERYLLAFGAGFLAGLTRPTAVVLPLLFLVDAAVKARGGKKWLPTLLAATAPGFGVLAFLCYTAYSTGRWDAYLAVQAGWGYRSSIPYLSLIRDLQHLHWEYLTYAETVRIASAMAVLLMLAWGWKKIPFAWALYVVFSLLLIHSSEPNRSTARYELVLFPLFLLIPQIPAARLRVTPYLMIAAAIVEIYLLHKFTTWQWVA